MKTKQKVMFIMVLTFLIYGCGWHKVTANFNNLFSKTSQHGIVGKWKLKDSAMGPYIVTLYKDHTYDVDLNGDGAKDVWGEYDISIDKIKFTDQGGQISSSCHDSGYYKYKIKGNEIHYELLGDQCIERMKALEGVWVRA